VPIGIQETKLSPMPATPEQRPSLPWYVVHTCSRHEALVETGLARKGLEVFLPRVTVRSRRRDRLRMLEVPLFPGYLFVQTDLSDRDYYHIIKQEGVVRILGTRGYFTPVPEDTVVSLRTLVNSGQLLLPWARIEPGRRVRVVDGPLAGATGVILRLKKGNKRLVVGVELLGRSVCAELAEESIEIEA
jgi:transcriptional antiterminator NusG